MPGSGSDKQQVLQGETNRLSVYGPKLCNYECITFKFSRYVPQDPLVFFIPDDVLQQAHIVCYLLPERVRYFNVFGPFYCEIRRGH